MGASDLRLVMTHVLPVAISTILTVATLDFGNVMLNESALSFLGIGVQTPKVTWGLMVAQGRNNLSQAWWLTAFPGLAIMFTTMAANLLSNWVRVASDPVLRWRLEVWGEQHRAPPVAEQSPCMALMPAMDPLDAISGQRSPRSTNMQPEALPRCMVTGSS